MLYDTESVIAIAKVSQYLSEKQIMVKTALDGGRIDRRHPRLLYIARITLENLYNDGSFTEYLTLLTSYVYSLCAPFYYQAQYIINNNGGGVIVNPTNPTGDMGYVTYSDSETFEI